jgi:hypothetical protein
LANLELIAGTLSRAQARCEQETQEPLTGEFSGVFVLDSKPPSSHAYHDIDVGEAP